MRLSHKLFLCVALLFFLTFFLSFLWEGLFVRQQFRSSEEVAEHKILELNASKQKRIASFIDALLSDYKARLDALLQQVKSESGWRTAFMPPEGQGSWLAGLHLVAANEWIDYLQNTRGQEEGFLESALLFPPSSLRRVQRIPLSGDLFWVTDKKSTPYIGVTLPSGLFPPVYEESASLSGMESLLLFTADPSSCCASFDEEKLPQEVRVLFKERLEQLRALLQTLPTAPHARKAWIAHAVGAPPYALPHHGEREDCAFLSLRLPEALLRFFVKRDLIAMGTHFALAVEALGLPPTSPRAPVGIAHFPAGDSEGLMTRREQLFASSPLFDTAAFLHAHPAKGPCGEVPKAMAAFSSHDGRMVFFGNGIALSEGAALLTPSSSFRPAAERPSVTPAEAPPFYLLIATHVTALLQQFIDSMQQDLVVISGDHVVAALLEGGKQAPRDFFGPKELKEIGERFTGIIELGGQRYIYLNVVPSPDLDLRFLFLNKEENALFAVEHLQDQARLLMKRLTLHTRLIALGSLLLALLATHRIARTMTDPIASLERAARAVAEGHLDQAHLPSISHRASREMRGLLRSFEAMVQGLKEREKVKAILNKVISLEIAQQILKEGVNLGGEERIVTMLFGDIRGFTRLTQKMPSQEVIALVNQCMTLISREIDRHAGVIDKYIGDEVMALFGAPIVQEEGPLLAIRAATAILESLRLWNEKRHEEGLPPIEMGIGIHTGAVTAGNMGAANRLNYTVIGSQVNFAHRLCEQAHGMEILISEATLRTACLAGRVEVEALPPVQLKGFDEPVSLYRVVGIR